MSSFSYNITISTYNKLLNSLDVLYAVNAIILGYTTEGLKLINANTVRFTFENNAELDGGGLYAIRCLIDDDNNVNNKKNNIYVGIACILKNECKCETIFFAPSGRLKKKKKNNIPMLENNNEKIFPIGTKVQLQILSKCNEFSSIAHNAWLHDHIQQSLLKMHQWSRM